MRRVVWCCSVAMGLAVGLLLGCEQKPAGSQNAKSSNAREAAGGGTHDHDHDHDGHEHPASGETAITTAAEHAEGDDADADCSGHKAPRGGTLVPLGKHFAHLEVLLDKDAGRLDVYVLDGHAEHAVRCKTAKLDMTVRVVEHAGTAVADAKPLSIELAGVASALSGETTDDTSHYSATNDELKGATKIEATLLKIALKGEELLAIRFAHPAEK